MGAQLHQETFEPNRPLEKQQPRPGDIYAFLRQADSFAGSRRWWTSIPAAA
jgi:hypothetical protein